ncbi:arabinose ABC transporter permease [Intrasporangium oryzae NRRL B-24470]|uniref:Arabinose ABC transporter permease n=1 Tax=Intrasporangium oryzae NRRL B-24470 TaxID=1386089 RepID=W9GBK2_9MICO|nr:MFS transporter [Intrasporangium oryzae]EWT03450.1 arabinose ABC transporter permease [Intrasporangium oryzae NRRL B-24470]
MIPSKHRATYAILALAIGGFAIGTTEFVTMGLLPQIAAGTGVSIATAGHYVSAYALGVVVGAPLIAVVAARVPRKGLLMGLMAFFAVAHLAILAANSYATVMGARFLAGIPHGAFFGIGSVVAASLVPHERRTAAVAMILGGLAVSNVVGVPVATVLGQRVSWHAPYVAVGLIAALTVLAIATWMPHQPANGEESMRTELRALRRPQVWLALLIGTVGFGGMFAMYSYITPTMTDLAGLDERYIPWVLAAYGIGMVAGMVLSGRVARYGILRGIIASLGLIAALLAVFGPAAHVLWLAVVMVFLLGLVPSILVPLLQTRLMDVAHEGQSLAAALNHSTLNTANALGAWLGSVVLTLGWGYGAPSLVGAVLAVLGVGVAVLSAVLERRTRTAVRGEQELVAA